MTENKHDAVRHWVTRFGEAWQAGDESAFAALFAADAIHYRPLIADPCHGRSEICARWSQAVSTQRDMRFSFDVLHEHKGNGTVHWRCVFLQADTGNRVTRDGIMQICLNERSLCSEFREWWHTDSATSIQEIRTERLLLRQWKPADFEPFADYYANQETARFVGGRCDRESAWRRFASQIGHWSLRGYGYWALQERDGNRFAGAAGLWFSDGWPEMELGYWLTPAARCNGYATEAAGRAKQVAFEVLGCSTLVSYIHEKNLASQRVAERLGGQFESVIPLLHYGEHRVYRYPRS